MNLTKSIIIYSIGLISFLCCNKGPISTDYKVELKADFSEAEFKNAIIGKWQSVYEIEGEENIIYLSFSEQGIAKITLEKDSIEKEYEGNYVIGFLRPPSKGTVTLARLTIITSKGNILLSMVNFGLHNALPAETGPFLRIDESPYGVLKKL